MLPELFPAVIERAKPETTPQPVTPAQYPNIYAGAKKAIEVENKDPIAVKAKFKELTGQDYDSYKPESSAESTVKTTEIPAIKYITTQADLDNAIKGKLLKPNEVKAAKEKIKALSLQNKETKTNQAEQDRIKKIQETTIKNSPLAPFTL